MGMGAQAGAVPLANAVLVVCFWLFFCLIMIMGLENKRKKLQHLSKLRQNSRTLIEMIVWLFFWIDIKEGGKEFQNCQGVVDNDSHTENYKLSEFKDDH
jgi:hypothetical protein